MRLRREETFEAGPEEVWEAISDEGVLERWLGDEVELDPSEGSPVRVRTGDDERTGEVVEVDEGRRIAFTWAAPGEEDSLVELTVVPAAGGTRLVVTETAPAAPQADRGWAPRMQALHGALALVPA